PVVLNQTAATAWVDGQSLLGPVIGTFCMNLAIEKAKQSGIGLVVATGGNHFGIAGYYSTMALKHNLLVSLLNSSIGLSPNPLLSYDVLGNGIHQCLATCDCNSRQRALF